MSFNPTRRDFLRGSAATLAGLALGAPAMAQGRRSDKVRFAVVGVGGRGGANLNSAARFGEVVALCDIDLDQRTKAMAAHPDAVSFEDFRRMLDIMEREIDAVVVSTPDHTHAPAAAMAMHMGKHVYCEKPLTRTIGEARRLAEIARSKRVVTQMGNQGTAQKELRQAAELIRKGALGTVKEVHCWTDRCGGWWPQGVERPAPGEKPKTVDFDLWLGPSPERPYAKGYHPFAWRGWWDFGSGALGDIGCHCMNLPFMALDLRNPTSVHAQTSGHNRDSFPAWSIVTYEFPENRGRKPVTLLWYDGGKKPPQEIAPKVEMGGNGCFIVCERATIYSPGEYGGGSRLVSGETMPQVEIEESPGHFAEFVAAIMGRGKAVSSIPEYSGPLTETVLLGNLAVWADGDKVLWDARRLTVKDHPEYDALVRPKYREGWSL